MTDTALASLVCPDEVLGAAPDLGLRGSRCEACGEVFFPVARGCTRCGSGRLFRGWFTIEKSCPRCGLAFEREEGAFLGSLVLNYSATGVAFIATLVVWLVLDLPDVQVPKLMLACIGVSVLVPLAFYPFAKTLWAAVDLLLQREH